ncbi:MAG TPA: biotin-dependent carboxyltransferase family protein [Candidatus Dormibacteraeota bacterium]|nr:biotin-dependent carboxyltransferase family protein [Candidatus Dormibacteraeota bacterium]
MKQVMRVMKPGLFTTVQDLGRPNAISAGVPPGGAMDRFAHRAANLMAGNDEGAATLECTLSGPGLIALEPCLVAITGADFDPQVNDEPVQMWTSIFLSEGDELSFAGRRSGARAYIAVAGGIEGDRWLGSLSTYMLAARGGMHGRLLKAGDEIGIAGQPSAPAISGRQLAHALRPRYSDHTLHAIAGPHIKRLGAEGRKTLFGSPFSVSRDADRMGYRLEGPVLDASGDELLSFGLTAGAIQVPRSGQPILLMADHQTAGGYPVVATVASAAMPVAAQLLPGDEVTFAEVSIEAALRMRAAHRAALELLRS